MRWWGRGVVEHGHLRRAWPRRWCRSTASRPCGRREREAQDRTRRSVPLRPTASAGRSPRRVLAAPPSGRGGLGLPRSSPGRGGWGPRRRPSSSGDGRLVRWRGSARSGGARRGLRCRRGVARVRIGLVERARRERVALRVGVITTASSRTFAVGTGWRPGAYQRTGDRVDTAGHDDGRRARIGARGAAPVLARVRGIGQRADRRGEQRRAGRDAEPAPAVPARTRAPGSRARSPAPGSCCGC